MAEALPVKSATSVVDAMNEMRDRIMGRAYDIFLSNGSIFGNELDNWLQAERETIWKPAIELAEKDNAFCLEVALPGVDPKNLTIEVTPEEILLKADLHHEHKSTKGDIHICEFASGNLFRTIHFPKKIDPNNVKAEFKNGMLTVKAPVAAGVRTRKVAIEAA